jgi:CheY-like chemotaxis protein
MELNAVVRSALEICDAEIRARDLTVELACSAATDRSVGDPIRLQQAVWNLINNAAKFSPRKGRIRISTANPRDQWIAIAVQDDGIGFDAADAAKLFDAFEQGGKEVTRQFGGLGLGLAITRSIVLAHGGIVRAHSDGRNRGALFTIELPLRPDVPVTAPAHADTTLRQPPAGMRILLVEDHRDTRHTMETILRRDHLNVVSAGTAREALALAERHRFDVLIADLGLPDQSGLELMKQLGPRFGLHGIATSGYGMDDDIAECRAAGFDYHLTKPVRIAQLRTLLAELSALHGQS